MDNLGNRKSGRIREVSAYGWLKMYCKYVDSNMTSCPLTSGARLREVPVSISSTVTFITINN